MPFAAAQWITKSTRLYRLGIPTIRLIFAALLQGLVWFLMTLAGR